MINIKNGRDIYFTIGDTFEMTVTPDDSVSTNTSLRMQITNDEFATSPLITQTFNYDTETESFNVTLTNVNNLTQGEYIYRLSLITNNETVTTTSGAFVVQWGVC